MHHQYMIINYQQILDHGQRISADAIWWIFHENSFDERIFFHLGKLGKLEKWNFPGCKVEQIKFPVHVPKTVQLDS